MRKYKQCVVSDDCSKCQETKLCYDQEKEEGRGIKFFMGLNESFTHIRTHIIELRELPNLDVAYDMVSNNESERNIAKVVCMEASAMYVQQEATYKQQMQSQRYGNHPTGKVKQRPYCTHCQLNDHTKEHYYKLNGYPAGHRLYRVKVQDTSQLLIMSLTVPLNMVPRLMVTLPKHPLLLLLVPLTLSLLNRLTKYENDQAVTSGDI
ncbi:hypothetical protein QQ045_017819 [Rhodiola kirilowii]